MINVVSIVVMGNPANHKNLVYFVIEGQLDPGTVNPFVPGTP